MRLEHYPVEKLKKEILKILSRHLDLKKHTVFFFGSRIVGTGDQTSDIDIGVEGPSEIPFITMAKIKEDLEKLPILYKIEIVDFSTVDESFKNVALKHTELLTKHG